MSNLKRYGHPKPKLVIWVPDDISPRAESLLVWHLKRLSLVEQEVAVDYACNYVKPVGEHYGLTYVIAGKDLCKPLTSYTFAKVKYMKLIGQKIWISHGFGYGLVDAGENQAINRLLYLAAECAGTPPIVDLTVPLFQHFIQK